MCTRIAEGSGSGRGAAVGGGAVVGAVGEAVGGAGGAAAAEPFEVEVELGGIGVVEEREEVKSWSQ